VVRGKPELLLNGDFEAYTGTQDNGVDDALASWDNAGTGGGDIIESTATAHTGAGAALLTFGNDGCNISQAFWVRPGFNYRLTFWTRGDGVRAGRYGVYDSTNLAFIIANTATGISGTAYTKLTIMFATPQNCVRVRVYLLSSIGAGDVYFDDASVRLD
jgi:hypothetical protein